METKNEFNETEEIQENILYAESIFGHNTRRGLVRLSYGVTFDACISPEEARFYAMSILEAATAAETDEILMIWLSNVLGISDDQKLTAVLRDFREIRTAIRERELKEAKEAVKENKNEKRTD